MPRINFSCSEFQFKIILEILKENKNFGISDSEIEILTKPLLNIPIKNVTKRHNEPI